MVRYVRKGMAMRLHYRRGSRNPLEGAACRVVKVGWGPGPRNVLVNASGVGEIVVTRGNLVRPEAYERSE